MIQATGARPRAASFNLREQLSILNMHWAGVAVLGLVNLYLLVHMALLWQQAKSQDADAQAQQRITLQLAQQSAKPLEGLDTKLKTADEKAARFYAERLPVSYSEIATQLGQVAQKNGVRLTRVQYAQAAVPDVQAIGQLTEIKMDAGLTGDYRALVEFLNGLERDKSFFVINGVTLTGQEGGKVNLRLRLTTYMRGLSSDEEAAQASTPAANDVSAPDAVPAAQAGGAR